jgi:hypothetical protein
MNELENVASSDGDSAVQRRGENALLWPPLRLCSQQQQQVVNVQNDVKTHEISVIRYSS